MSSSVSGAPPGQETTPESRAYSAEMHWLPRGRGGTFIKASRGGAGLSPKLLKLKCNFCLKELKTELQCGGSCVGNSLNNQSLGILHT